MVKQGRPTKYKPEYCQQVIDFMAEGNSATQFAVHMGVHKSTIYQWAIDYPAFSDAFTRAREACEAYWEHHIQRAMFSRDANAQLFKYYFANRFKWHDKPESLDAESQPTPVTVNIQVEDARLDSDSQ